jgi:protein-S-isoprenylcysteine O-methyltransferase Ste14
MSKRISVAGILGGIFFAVGLLGGFATPGGAGTTNQDFLNFYNSSSKRLTALLSYFVLVIGCWLFLWLFSELLPRLSAHGVRADLGHRLGTAGIVLVMVGGGIYLGPAAVQIESSSTHFVGTPVAFAFAEAGLILIIVGAWTMSLGVFLTSHQMRATETFPRWLGMFGMVVGVLVLLTAFLGIPILLLAIWAIVVGISGARLTNVSTAS